MKPKFISRARASKKALCLSFKRRALVQVFNVKHPPFFFWNKAEVQMNGKLRIFIAACVVTLSACGGGGNAPSAPPSVGPGTWPDHSAQVESVGGQNPAKFFIANGPALNAVDADGNGLWDDIEERLSSSAVVQAEDQRLVRMMIRGYQQTLMVRTMAEAKELFRFEEHLTACARYLGETKGHSEAWINESQRVLSREIEAAVFVSKQRVLAAAYANALASGGRYTSPDANPESCNK